MLNSNPGASATLYLDFNGDSAQSWGSYSVPTTPAFDQDGDVTSFSDSELTTIREIWARVAEAYSPFNINVTTVDTGNLNNLQTIKAVIGGSGAWLGAAAGGVSYIGSFANSAHNVAWVFPNQLGGGNAKYTSDAATHESGHAFGLPHQSTYSGATWSQIATPAGDTTSYSDTGLVAGTKYYYRLRATSSVGSSANATAVNATTRTAQPTLSVTVVSSAQVNLAWSNVLGETGYRVERSLNGSDWSLLGTTAANVISLSNIGLTAGTAYSYRVVAIDAGGDSTAGTASTTTLLAAPTGLTATTGGGGTEFDGAIEGGSGRIRHKGISAAPRAAAAMAVNPDASAHCPQPSNSLGRGVRSSIRNFSAAPTVAPDAPPPPHSGQRPGLARRS